MSARLSTSNNWSGQSTLASTRILPVARISLLIGVVAGFHRRNCVCTRKPAIEVDVLAAPGTKRPKAFGRGLAADGAGPRRVKWFAHAVQITPRPQLSKCQIPALREPAGSLRRLRVAGP